MQRFAAWLTARTHNSALALAVALVLPFLQFVSGILMVFVVLQKGLRFALTAAAIAVSILAVVALLTQAPLQNLLAVSAVTLLPPLLLAALLAHWRSLTLTLQVSVIVALAATLGLHVFLQDPVAFGDAILGNLIALFEEAGLGPLADGLRADRESIAPQMIMVVVSTNWLKYVVQLLLGYALLQTLPDKKGIFGRYCDLNFGRVLAFVLVLAALGAFVVEASWVRNLALMAFAVFWIQGLAIVHWLRAENRLPGFVVGMTYAMLLFFAPAMVASLALAGYVDAWFDFRPRRV